MREILFRGKTIDGGNWIEGSFAKKIHEHYFVKGVGKYGLIENVILDEFGRKFEVDPKTVGQFRGLKDKNGTKIFEGDIVKDEFGNIFEVYYNSHFLRWHLRNKEKDFHIFEFVYPKMQLEIIGNIHERPELLN